MALTALLISALQLSKDFTFHKVSAFNFEFSWGANLGKILLNNFSWLLFIPFISRWVSALGIGKKVSSSLLPLVLWFPLTALAHRVLASRLLDLMNWIRNGYLRDFFGSNSRIEIIVGSFTSALELIAIILVLLAIWYQKRFITQQKVLAQARLTALKMQLNPHFLFNVLHSVATLIDHNPRKAQQMISKLGTMLRQLLEEKQGELVVLEQEVEFLKQYLDMEQVRFDQLHVNYDLDPECLQWPLPYLILQPLVENAVKFGTRSGQNKSEITIRSRKDLLMDRPALTLEVENSIIGERINAQKGTGTGLRNIRERLEALYQYFVFETDHPQRNKFVARITIPYA